MNTRRSDNSTISYWATRRSNEVVEEFLKRRRSYSRFTTLTGRAVRMLRSWNAFYGYGVDGKKSNTYITSAGQQGELQQLTPPMYSTLLRQTKQLIVGTKPAFKTRAVNSDENAIVEAMFGDTLLEYYDTYLDLTKLEDDAVQSGLMLGSGYVVVSWTPGAGESVDVNPDTGALVKEGDISALSLTPWDVCFNAKSPETQREWIGFRTRVNRFNLAQLARDAGNPALADRIITASRQREPSDEFETVVPLELRFPYDEQEGQEDLVFVWEMRHLPTPALPKGRLIRFIDSKTILYDSAEQPAQIPNVSELSGDDLEEAMTNYFTDNDGNFVEDVGYPYEDLGVYEFMPEMISGAYQGYTNHFDLLAMQEAVEAMATAAYSNINIGALTNFWLPEGVQPNIEMLATGFNLFQSSQKPELLNNVQISPAMMQFMGLLREFSQQAVGVSDPAMGEVKSGMPAQLAALLEAKSIQFNAAGQKSYYRLVERVRTGVLLMLKRFVSEPRTVELLGEASEWAVKEWSNKDIAGVRKVTVEPVNPQMKTFAGRMAMVDMLGDSLDKDAKKTLMLTGSLEEKLDAPKAWEGLLAKQKSLLRKGIGLPPLDQQKTEEATQMNGGEFTPVFAPSDKQEYVVLTPLDPVWDWIPEYTSVIASSEARRNNKVVTATLDVIQEALRIWRNMSPDILALLGGQPAPTSEMSMAGKGVPMPSQGPGPQQNPGLKGGPPQLMQSPQLQAQKAVEDVKQPRPPTNPLSGGELQ